MRTTPTIWGERREPRTRRRSLVSKDLLLRNDLEIGRWSLDSRVAEISGRSGNYRIAGQLSTPP